MLLYRSTFAILTRAVIAIHFYQTVEAARLFPSEVLEFTKCAGTGNSSQQQRRNGDRFVPLTSACRFFNYCVRDKAMEASASTNVAGPSGAFRDFQCHFDWLPWRQYEGALVPTLGAGSQRRGYTLDEPVVMDFPAVELLLPLEQLQDRFVPIILDPELSASEPVSQSVQAGDIAVRINESWNDPARLLKLREAFSALQLPAASKALMEAEKAFIAATNERRRQLIARRRLNRKFQNNFDHEAYFQHADRIEDATPEVCSCAAHFELHLLNHLDQVLCGGNLATATFGPSVDQRTYRQLLRARVLHLFEEFLTELRRRQDPWFFHDSDVVDDSCDGQGKRRYSAVTGLQRDSSDSLLLLPDLNWNLLFLTFVEARIRNFTASAFLEPVVLTDSFSTAGALKKDNHHTSTAQPRASLFFASLGSSGNSRTEWPYRKLLKQVNMFEGAFSTAFEQLENDRHAKTDLASGSQHRSSTSGSKEVSAIKKMRTRQPGFEGRSSPTRSSSKRKSATALGSTPALLARRPRADKTQFGDDGEFTSNIDMPSPAALYSWKQGKNSIEQPHGLQQEMRLLSHALEEEIQREQASAGINSGDGVTPSSTTVDMSPATSKSLPEHIADCTSELPPVQPYDDDFRFGLELSNCVQSLDRLQAKLDLQRRRAASRAKK